METRKKKRSDYGTPRIDYRTKHWEFENRVREVRLEEGLTQQALADRAGVKSYTAVAGLEFGMISPFYSGGKMKPWVTRIAEILNASLTYLFPREICDIRRNEFTYDQALELTTSCYSTSQDPEALVIRKQQRAGLIEATRCLPARDRLVILLRFFMDRTLLECVKAIGCSPIGGERARQLEARGIRKLRWEAAHGKYSEWLN
jgi:transcriptional regulator with XRE-family HTH domain